jgi:phenylacetate-coenzyme A ligase PaaK-like adenylate-forming protein
MEEDPAARLRPRALIVSGENLYDSDRAWLEEWYGCPIINAYLSTEAGLIGVDCVHGRDFHVPTDRLVVEVLLADGTLAAEGSGELVITNVTNWAQPFVRYRQSDQVTLHRGTCACGFTGPTVSALCGRDAAMLEVKDVGPVATARLEPILTRPEIRQYEVARYPDGLVVVRYILARGCAEAPLAAALSDALRPILGGSFTLTRTDEITAWGGKLRHFVERRYPE